MTTINEFTLQTAALKRAERAVERAKKALKDAADDLLYAERQFLKGGRQGVLLPWTQVAEARDALQKTIDTVVYPKSENV